MIKRHCKHYYDGWYIIMHIQDSTRIDTPRVSAMFKIFAFIQLCMLSTRFSRAEMDRILREHTLEYGEDIDLTRYEKEVRTTLNPTDGAANPTTVWKHFDQGCSVRFLCPQKFCDNMWKLLSILEEEWGCFAGANSYLTPRGTQGFAPHYDDIEAFLMQVEGRKHWKLYAPRSPGETLPRLSSGNFTQTEIGTPLLDIVLDEGNLLYFPRGFIYQAHCSEYVG